jgi:hypothetical protein
VGRIKGKHGLMRGQKGKNKGALGTGGKKGYTIFTNGMIYHECFDNELYEIDVMEYHSKI